MFSLMYFASVPDLHFGVEKSEFTAALLDSNDHFFVFSRRFQAFHAVLRQRKFHPFLRCRLEARIDFLIARGCDGRDTTPSCMRLEGSAELMGAHPSWLHRANRCKGTTSSKEMAIVEDRSRSNAKIVVALEQ